MIRIAAIALHGAPLGRSLATDFDASGGSIGRATTNQLVLEDPDRTVSRVHAQVLVRDGRYFIVDRGSNPMQCDGRQVGAGNEVPLRGGERLVIGGLELTVELLDGVGGSSLEPVSLGDAFASAPQVDAAAGSVDDPFSHLLALLGSAAPDVGPARVPADRAPIKKSRVSARSSPFFTRGAAASATSKASDPFANLLKKIARLQRGRTQKRGEANHGVPFELTNTVLPTISVEYLQRLASGSEISRVALDVKDADFTYAFD